MTITVKPMESAPDLWQYTISAPSGREWIGQGYANESAARKAAQVRVRRIEKGKIL